MITEKHNFEVSRPTVAKELLTLSRLGWVKKLGRSYKIIDYDKVMRMLRGWY